MATQKEVHRGHNLQHYRKKIYKSAVQAVEHFVRQGCSIKYPRYLKLESGIRPSDQELAQICKMLNILPHDWLYKHDPDFEDHCNTFLELQPNTRKIVMDFIALECDTQQLAMNIMNDLKQHDIERRESNNLG